MVNHPESLEKIFQKLEQESARRAQAEEARAHELEEKAHEELESRESSSSPLPMLSSARATVADRPRERRRGSISISRFGQVEDGDLRVTTFSVPTTPSIGRPIAAFYQGQSRSSDSLASHESDRAPGRLTESDHVTQVHHLAARQSLSRSVGGMISRKLSRSASKNSLAGAGLDSGVIIGVGVVIEEASHVVEDGGIKDLRAESRAAAYADVPKTDGRLRGMSLKGRLGKEKEKEKEEEAGEERDGWVRKAKGLGKEMKRRSRAMFLSPSRAQT